MNESPKKEPSIRTMRSDISEFLKTNKPSLVSLLTRQAQLEEDGGAEREPRISPKTIAAFFIIAAVIGGLVTYLLKSSKPSKPVQDQSAAPPPLIFFEGLREITIGKTSQELLKALMEISVSKQPPGSLQRAVIRIRNQADLTQVAELKDFAELSGMHISREFLENVIAPPQFFAYHQKDGPRLGLIVQVRNPARALQSLLSDEPSLQRDWEAMFLNSPPPSVLESFRDMAYKNIDFRYLTIDEDRDRGLGYLNFPAQRLIVIATSQESLRLIIERLLRGG